MGVFDTVESVQLSSCVVKPYVDAAEWAKTYRKNEFGEEFVYTDFPFLEEPTRAMSDIARVSCVVIKSCAQIGKSTAIENFLGWMCDFYRSNSLIVFESLKTARRFVKQRLQPFLKRSVGLQWRRQHSSATSENESNSLSAIGLGHEGATLFVGTASSPSDLCSMPAGWIMMDELDRWPLDLGIEGDPVTLAMKRGVNFRGMCILTSTPTSKNGRICEYFERGTMESWCAVCECGFYMDVRWQDIDFSGSVPVYACRSCGVVYTQDEIKRLKHGFSSPKNENPRHDRFGRIYRSFEILGTLHHARYTWEQLKLDEIDALKIGVSGHRSFINTSIGDYYEETSDDEVDRMTPEALKKACESDYTSDLLPENIEFLTIGCDTHDNCIYAEIVGFSADLKQQYGVMYDLLVGDPAEYDVWKDLHALFDKEFLTEDGRKLVPRVLFIDSGGHKTHCVYFRCATTKFYGFWIPCKGFTHRSNAAVQREAPVLYKRTKVQPSGIKRRVWLQTVHTGTVKDDLEACELSTMDGSKRLFYPKKACYDDDYFSGLLSETRDRYGRWRASARRRYDDGRSANEPLDCRVYAIAAAHYYMIYFYEVDKKGESMSKKGKKVKENVDKTENTIQIQDVDLKKESTRSTPSADDDAKSKSAPSPQKQLPKW